MPTKIYEIDLDIKNPEYRLVPYIEVVSGDTDANIFNIQLFENFVPLNASGNTAVIIFEKPDKKTVYQNLTIVDANAGKYTCTLSSQTILVPGRIKAEVALYEGTKKVTSTKFEFAVRKSLLNENTVESSNEFTALTEALQTVNQYDGRIEANEVAIATHEAESVTDDDGVHGIQVSTIEFDPVLEFGGASTGLSYASRFGRETKVAGLVFVEIRIVLSNKGTSTGGARIQGLPTPTTAGANIVCPILSERLVYGNAKEIMGAIGGGSTNIRLREVRDSATLADLTDASFVDNTSIMLNFVYFGGIN
jgi:hypothetical protein